MQVDWHDGHSKTHCRIWAGFWFTVLTCQILTISIVTALTARANQPSDAWAPLLHKTGWVLLGDVDTKTNTWATTVRHTIKSPERSNPIGIPRRNDRIEITMEAQLVIVGFQTHGERDRALSPAGRLITKEDLTGIKLLPGTMVVVLDIRLDPSRYGVQHVWAQVTAAADAKSEKPKQQNW
jgi:hypothetical protein